MATQSVGTDNPALLALAHLKANPLDFLHFNIIMMGGAPTSGEHQFYLEQSARPNGSQSASTK